MVPAIDRRYFLSGVGALVTAGCTTVSSGGDAGGTDESDPVEKGGFELANIQGHRMQTYVGVSAEVYNNNSNQGTVTVEFAMYDANDNKLYDGTDSVTVDPRAQALISRFWEIARDNPPAQSWDAKIISVQ